MTFSSYRKGILLAGGLGKRLAPITSSISKQLLPVYDKPMIYYPLSTLMLSGVRDILIISNPDMQNIFKEFLGDGTKFGMNFSYAVQQKPEGIAQALLIGERFVGDDLIAVALGDNLFHGNELIDLLLRANSRKDGSTIFAYPVRDPEKYGVVGFDNLGNVTSIVEKPLRPLSQYAVTGLYFYDNSAVERAKKLQFSSRGELEITSLNQGYLDDGLLKVELMGRGMAWLDTGTFDSLQDAGAYIRTLESRQGLKVGCPEEVAWRMGWIKDSELENIANNSKKSDYGNYLFGILNNRY